MIFLRIQAFLQVWGRMKKTFIFFLSFWKENFYTAPWRIFLKNMVRYLAHGWLHQELIANIWHDIYYFCFKPGREIVYQCFAWFFWLLCCYIWEQTLTPAVPTLLMFVYHQGWHCAAAESPRRLKSVTLHSDCADMTLSPQWPLSLAR